MSYLIHTYLLNITFTEMTLHMALSALVLSLKDPEGRHYFLLTVIVQAWLHNRQKGNPEFLLYLIIYFSHLVRAFV